MELKEIYSKLCCKDPRNPIYKDIYNKDWINFMDGPPIPRVNCYCDNCFSGRDTLALEIINLNELLNRSTK